jgi:hypothetical protein
VTKIYLAAMSRADESAATMSKLPPFYLFVDEFQSFADKSFADILSEARKYKLALTMAHQYIEQMEEEVRDAVFGNVGTMVTFRVGAYDADVLEKEFAPVFTAEDIVNLGLRQIYLKLMIDSVSSQPFSATTMPPIPLPAVTYVDEVVGYSRKTYAKEREEVEQAIIEWHTPVKTVEAPKAPVIKYPKKTEPQPIDTRSLSSEKPKTVPEPPVDIPRPRETEMQRKPAMPKVTLETLKNKADNQRKPDQKNVAELRNILKAMVREEKPKQEPPKPAPNPVFQAVKKETSPQPKVEAKKEPTPDELKKLLGVE